MENEKHSILLDISNYTLGVAGGLFVSTLIPGSSERHEKVVRTTAWILVFLGIIWLVIYLANKPKEEKIIKN